MARALGDYSPEELIRMADGHQAHAFRDAFEGCPELRCNGGYCEILTGLRHPIANTMFGLNIPEVEGTVADLTARINRLGAPSMWWVGPCTQPSNLREILLSHGWAEGPPAPALVIDLADAEQRFRKAVDTCGAELRLVQTDNDLAIWHDTAAAGFSMPLGVARLFTPTAITTFYTAFLDGEPVGTTALSYHDDVAGIYCVSTRPEFRGRGIGAAVTAGPLLQAYENGSLVGTLQASKMGYPVYKRLGFQDVCTITPYTLACGEIA